MKKLSLAYFGTPYFSSLFLEKLINDKELPIELKYVVTQPDKPVGRKQIITASPVKVVAQNYGIKVLDSLRSLEQYYSSSQDEEKSIDIAFLYAYGGILPKKILEYPCYGFWNTHPSLLPKYRGASPTIYPLILGDKETGVTLIKLDEEIDHGPIIAQQKVEILPHECRPDLEVKLTNRAFELFKKTLISTDFNQLKLTEQDHAQATFTRQLEKSDGFIPLKTLKKSLNNEPLLYEELPTVIREYLEKTEDDSVKLGHVIYNLYRGLYPWPGVWTKINIKGQNKRLKITDMTLEKNTLILKKVQLEGKKEVIFETFNRVYKIF
ncbi:methionyl-tRNA formyltransferase [Candidatus Roizmanbacteria bacterium]|nr:methionyl-tRNA formyltransferase [Candidatus Roizmanbacteria bacterium]